MIRAVFLLCICLAHTDVEITRHTVSSRGNVHAESPRKTRNVSQPFVLHLAEEAFHSVLRAPVLTLYYSSTVGNQPISAEVHEDGSVVIRPSMADDAQVDRRSTHHRLLTRDTSMRENPSTELDPPVATLATHEELKHQIKKARSVCVESPQKEWRVKQRTRGVFFVRWTKDSYSWAKKKAKSGYKALKTRVSHLWKHTRTARRYVQKKFRAAKFGARYYAQLALPPNVVDWYDCLIDRNCAKCTDNYLCGECPIGFGLYKDGYQGCAPCVPNCYRCKVGHREVKPDAYDERQCDVCKQGFLLDNDADDINDVCGQEDESPKVVLKRLFFLHHYPHNSLHGMFYRLKAAELVSPEECDFVIRKSDRSLFLTDTWVHTTAIASGENWEKKSNDVIVSGEEFNGEGPRVARENPTAVPDAMKPVQSRSQSLALHTIFFLTLTLTF